MTLHFKSEKEFQAWAEKAKPRLKGIEISLPPKPEHRELVLPPRRKARRVPEWLKMLGVAVYCVLLFVVLVAWRIARPFVLFTAGCFTLFVIIELIWRLGTR